MNILIIFTGGTIGSSVQKNTISTNQENKYLLLDLFKKKTGRDISFETTEPYYALSENNTGAELSSLIACVSSALKQNYDGIIITHGTDSLQYSAAALSCAFGNNTVPIVIVSSNYVLTDERSNGLINFEAAVSFIEQKGGNGVFVSYKNHRDIPRIHRASRLIAHSELSDDIHSAKNQFYGCFRNETFVKNSIYKEKSDEAKPFGEILLPPANEKISVIHQYVGLKYSDLNINAKAVIIKAYHSGTLCAENDDFISFAKDMKSKNIPCFICGSGNETNYESAEAFAECGVKILPCASFISQYIKLWFCAESGRDFEKSLFLSLGGDILP